jgi:hypothetical protein
MRQPILQRAADRELLPGGRESHRCFGQGESLVTGFRSKDIRRQGAGWHPQPDRAGKAGSIVKSRSADHFLNKLSVVPAPAVTTPADCVPSGAAVALKYQLVGYAENPKRSKKPKLSG